MEKVYFYYAEARLNGKVALLAGPFTNAPEALNALKKCKPFFESEYADAKFSATLGVAKFDRDLGQGRFNAQINQ